MKNIGKIIIQFGSGAITFLMSGSANSISRVPIEAAMRTGYDIAMGNMEGIERLYEKNIYRALCDM